MAHSICSLTMGDGKSRLLSRAFRVAFRTALFFLLFEILPMATAMLRIQQLYPVGSHHSHIFDYL